MKKLINSLLAAVATILLTSCMTLHGGAYAQSPYDGNEYYYSDNNYYNQGGVSIQLFYDALRPHGRWIRDSRYGDIWIPRVGRNFHPYATNGYWVMTDYGNTWVSDFSWGWAPFHYGRWFYDDYYGWAWIPGYEWAPAWVVWRNGGGYYGWAPMGPRMGINIQINLPINYWVFLPDRYMYNRNMHRYYPKRNQYQVIYNRTTIINNTYIYNNNRYYSGPTVNEYRTTTGRSVDVRKLEVNERSGRTTVSDRSVNAYAPVNSNPRSSGVSRSANTTNQTTRGSSSTTRSSSATSGNANSSTRSTTRESNSTPAPAANKTTTRSTNRSSDANATRSSSSSSTTRATTTRSSNQGSSSSRSSSSSSSRSSESRSSRSSSGGR
ncbi:DUF6600 domain-containing protein [Petrimonas mucosa]|uniref:Secreted protein n=1 Tax=Petrimonas mucosa TaxID=1642646 RepID=A0A1G4G5X7_9BACT|nr:DUF6600 domain-containing protein [Petrimonas mucosa]SCM56846.1 putative protein {ECO:0000313/EMBL:CEA16429,1} [Petrimonas mucosa]